MFSMSSVFVFPEHRQAIFMNLSFDLVRNSLGMKLKERKNRTKPGVDASFPLSMVMAGMQSK